MAAQLRVLGELGAVQLTGEQRAAIILSRGEGRLHSMRESGVPISAIMQGGTVTPTQGDIEEAVNVEKEQPSSVTPIHLENILNAQFPERDFSGSILTRVDVESLQGKTPADLTRAEFDSLMKPKEVEQPLQL